MSLWDRIFVFEDYGALLELVKNSIIAAAVLGVVGGVISVFVVYRDLPFAVHGVSELSFAGASGFLLLGANVVVGSLLGSLIAAMLIGVFGSRTHDRNSVIGVLMPFGLGLGVLFLALYKGRAANKFGLLTGQIVAVDTPQLTALVVIGVVVLAALAVMWRPLLFASLDPEVAAARGVPVRALSMAFMLVLGAAIAAAVQVVGALLVLSVMVTPAAAALQLRGSRVRTFAVSIAVSVVSLVGGVMLAVGGSLPISPYVTTIAFVFFLGCRGAALIRDRRERRGRRGARASTPTSGRTPTGAGLLDG